MLKTDKIYNILRGYKINDDITADPFYISLPQSSTENITILPSEIIHLFISKYGEFSLPYYDDVPALEAFLYEWKMYYHYNYGNWRKIIEAYSNDYNPIHNYDRTETRDYIHKYSTTVTGESNRENSTIYSGNETTKHTYSPDNDIFTTTNYARPFDVNNASYETTKQELSGSELTVTSPNTTVTETGNTHDTTTTDTTESTEKDTVNISGNIGVTTTQKMIEEEIELRKLDILNYIAVKFAEEHFILINGDENECRFLCYY